MKVRHYVSKDGDKCKIVKLTSTEKHRLRQENIRRLAEQVLFKRIFEETVNFADYTIPESDDSTNKTT